jgi:hypothetical protein
MSFSYTSDGRYLYIFWRLNTYLAKYSEGRTLGASTSTGLFLKASATTSNLKLAILSFIINYKFAGAKLRKNEQIASV